MKQLMHFLKLAWKASPIYIILLFFKSLIGAGQVLANIVLMKYLVDQLIGARDMKQLLLLGSLLVANNVLLAWLMNLLNRFINVKSREADFNMRQALTNKIMNLEYSYLEDPYYLDLKEKAVFAIHNQNSIEQLLTVFIDVLTHAFTIVGLIVILAQLGWVLFVLFFVSIVIDLLCLKYMNKTMVKVMSSIIPINRKMGYYMELMMEKQTQKDIRMYDMSDMINEEAEGFVKDTCNLFDKAWDAQGVSAAGMSISGSLVTAFAYTYVGLRVVSDIFGPRISLGALTMYVNAVIELASISVKLGEGIYGVVQHCQFLQPYLEFMMLEEETMDKNKEIFVGPVETVEFKNVTFSYPKSDKVILKDLSFVIHRGEKISIVGLNGAGKSTLVKLICRMYKAQSGEIYVNGKNIYDYDYMSYMKEISAVFQDYKLFNFTIEENVSCQQEETDEEKVNHLIDEVGLREKVEELPKKLKSQFGKEYDEEGIEMSGGQGQKVAIARALYKDSSMVILDEPASALDPIAEAEIYEKFNGLVDDKTAIYISHRMSSSVFCDKILIIDGGTVSDYDSHENLMKKTDSLYYKLFMAQAENYALD